MSCIHYKFKSSLDYDTITFEDLHVSLKELRDAICKAKKIGQSNDHKLEIVNAQTKKKYEDEQEMIPRNTSVIVQRVPVAATKQIASDKQKLQIFPQSEPKLLSAEEMMQNKMTDLAMANATEEEKLKVMMSQSSEGFDPTKYPTKPASNKQVVTGQVRIPPPTYVCFRCGQRGHWLRFCPTQGDTRYDSLAVKPLAGVPSSQLVTLDHHVPGAMIDRHGNYVMRSVDYEAILKKSKPTAPVKEVLLIPDELKCSMCSELMKDAVIIQCCGESFCDECIREYLLENDFTCPKCSETDVSPDTLMANKALRTAVKNHQNVNSEHRIVSQKVLDNVTTTAAVTTEKVDKKQNPVGTTTIAKLSHFTVTTTASNVKNVTTGATSTSVTMTTASNKKAALQLVSQLEQNILIKQAASSAAQEVITSDMLTVTESSVASHDSSSSTAHVNRSVSPTPPKQQQQQQPPVVTPSESSSRQSSSATVQPVVTQPTASVATTYSTNTAPTYKPALLPTPAAAASAVAAPTAVAASQLDPLAVAAAAALLLASGTSTTGSTASTAPDPASLLAADQLLQQELNNRSRSPAPLSAEEFYRQQNRLKNKNKRKHSSSTSSSPVRVHKRKHRHHHSNKSERKHKEHKSREEKSSRKQKRRKHHKEPLPDSPKQEHLPEVEFKMPHTRSAVTVIKRPTDPKVSLLAPDLESPVLPACVQNFTELEAVNATFSDQEIVSKNKVMIEGESSSSGSKATDVIKSVTTGGVNTEVKVIVKTAAATSSESLEEDGIEEGEILEGTGTQTPTGKIDPPGKDAKSVRKLKRKPSQSSELVEKPSSHKPKKRKWKKEKDVSGEKTKKHKLRLK